MGFFDLFKKKKKTVLTEEQLKMNKLSDLLMEGKLESPYKEIMEYQGEVDNGGHDQYFFNIENTGDLKKHMETLYTILPEKLLENLKSAHRAYLVTEVNDEGEEYDAAVEVMEGCDDVFYENEAEINSILEERASRIEL